LASATSDDLAQSLARLETPLFDCICFGPASQNQEARLRFREHLQGRLAWMSSLNAARGAKLRHLFDQIDW